MIHKIIREKRAEQGLSAQQVASQLGASLSTYEQFERGDPVFTLTDVNKLAQIFGATTRDFLEQSIRAELLEGDQEGLDGRVQRKDLEVLRQVLLYVLQRVGGKPNVGETVIHKLCYFIDFDYYEKFEENLMGATYVNNHYGPTSEDVTMVLREMMERGEVVEEKGEFHGRRQTRYRALVGPDMGVFSARDVEHMDDVLERLSDMNATEIGDYSHGDKPWRIAKRWEELFYESVFYRDGPYSVSAYDDEL